MRRKRLVVGSARRCGDVVVVPIESVRVEAMAVAGGVMARGSKDLHAILVRDEAGEHHAFDKHGERLLPKELFEEFDELRSVLEDD